MPCLDDLLQKVALETCCRLVPLKNGEFVISNNFQQQSIQSSCMLCALHLYTLHYYKSDTEPMQFETTEELLQCLSCY